MTTNESTVPEGSMDGPNTYKMNAPINVTSWTVVPTTRDVPSDDGRRMESRDEWWHIPTFVVEALDAARQPADPSPEPLWHGDGDMCIGAECLSIDEATGDHDTDLHSEEWWDGFTEAGRRITAASPSPQPDPVGLRERFVDGGGPRVAPYPPIGVEPTDTLAGDLYACSPTMLRLVADFLLEHGWTEPLDDEGTTLAALPVHEDEPTGIDVDAVRGATDAMKWVLPLVLAVREWRDTPRTTRDMRLGQRLEQAILDAINDLDDFATLTREASHVR